ncbi:uncharacterized protein G2W53_019920 [Senna tora]|uniref:Uncharacterized protein n=1 Tax=Senna tora TaxID=362788 RepID=A0A834WR57_9FABA|nr:uncharacterized protein G2W53_019920 [Senna tora]
MRHSVTILMRRSGWQPIKRRRAVNIAKEGKVKSQVGESVKEKGDNVAYEATSSIGVIFVLDTCTLKRCRFISFIQRQFEAEIPERFYQPIVDPLLALYFIFIGSNDLCTDAVLGFLM